jgi:hypothetical protein
MKIKICISYSRGWVRSFLYVVGLGGGGSCVTRGCDHDPAVHGSFGLYVEGPILREAPAPTSPTQYETDDDANTININSDTDDVRVKHESTDTEPESADAELGM